MDSQLSCCALVLALAKASRRGPWLQHTILQWNYLTARNSVDYVVIGWVFKQPRINFYQRQILPPLILTLTGRIQLVWFWCMRHQQIGTQTHHHRHLCGTPTQCFATPDNLYASHSVNRQLVQRILLFFFYQKLTFLLRPNPRWAWPGFFDVAPICRLLLGFFQMQPPYWRGTCILGFLPCVIITTLTKNLWFLIQTRKKLQK